MVILSINTLTVISILTTLKAHGNFGFKGCNLYLDDLEQICQSHIFSN